MSQGDEPRNPGSTGRFMSFESPAATQAGPSSYASAPGAHSTSVLSAPNRATQGPPIPTITIQRVLDPYRPVSRDYRGPDSLMQAAWRAAPMPKSFLEAIAQSRDIRENTYRTPNANLGRLAGPVTMPPATVPPPGWPADIATPPQHCALPAYESLTNIAIAQPSGSATPYQGSPDTVSSGHVTQLAGPLVPYQNPSGTVSSAQVTQSFGPNVPYQSLSGTVSSGQFNQSSGPTVPSESYSNTVSSRPPAPRYPPGLNYSPSTGVVDGPDVQWQRLPNNLPSHGLPSILEESDVIAENSLDPFVSRLISHVRQPSGSTVPSNGSCSIASPPALPPVYSTFEGGSYTSPFSSGHVTPRARPALPSERSSSTLSSGRSSPHLGSNLFAPGLRAIPGSLYDDQFVPPTLPTPPVVSSGRSTTPHLGNNLSTPMNAEMASSLRLAAVLESAARPYQQPATYNELGYYGPESEPRNQPVRFGDQSSYQATYQPNYQAHPFDPRVTYEAPFQAASQTTYQPSYLAPAFDPEATNEAPIQAASRPGYQPIYQGPSYDPQATHEAFNQLATQATLQPGYQAGHFDPRATYEPPSQLASQPTYQASSYNATYESASQPQESYTGWGRHYTYREDGYGEQASYGPQTMHSQPMQSQPMQYGQQYRSNTVPLQYENARILLPAPETLTVRSGPASSSRSIPRPSLERETWAAEPESRDTAVAKLEHAQRLADLAEFRVHQTQLTRRERKKSKQFEKDDKGHQQKKDDERDQQEDEEQWLQLERREQARRSNRR